MRRSLFCACLTLFLCGLVVLAAEKNGVLYEAHDSDRVRDGKTVIAFQQIEKKEKVGDPVWLPVSKDVKIVRLMYDKENKTLTTRPIEDGLRDGMFSNNNLGEKRLRVRIVTEGQGDKETVTEIRVIGLSPASGK